MYKPRKKARSKTPPPTNAPNQLSSPQSPSNSPPDQDLLHSPDPISSPEEEQGVGSSSPGKTAGEPLVIGHPSPPGVSLFPHSQEISPSAKRKGMRKMAETKAIIEDVTPGNAAPTTSTFIKTPAKQDTTQSGKGLMKPFPSKRKKRRVFPMTSPQGRMELIARSVRSEEDIGSGESNGEFVVPQKSPPRPIQFEHADLQETSHPESSFPDKLSATLIKRSPAVTQVPAKNYKNNKSPGGVNFLKVPPKDDESETLEKTLKTKKPVLNLVMSNVKKLENRNDNSLSPQPVAVTTALPPTYLLPVSPPILQSPPAGKLLEKYKSILSPNELPTTTYLNPQPTTKLPPPTKFHAIHSHTQLTPFIPLTPISPKVSLSPEELPKTTYLSQLTPKPHNVTPPTTLGGPLSAQREREREHPKNTRLTKQTLKSPNVTTVPPSITPTPVSAKDSIQSGIDQKPKLTQRPAKSTTASPIPSGHLINASLTHQFESQSLLTPKVTHVTFGQAPSGSMPLPAAGPSSSSNHMSTTTASDLSVKRAQRKKYLSARYKWRRLYNQVKANLQQLTQQKLLEEERVLKEQLRHPVKKIVKQKPKQHFFTRLINMLDEDEDDDSSETEEEDVEKQLSDERAIFHQRTLGERKAEIRGGHTAIDMSNRDLEINEQKQSKEPRRHSDTIRSQQISSAYRRFRSGGNLGPDTSKENDPFTKENILKAPTFETFSNDVRHSLPSTYAVPDDGATMQLFSRLVPLLKKSGSSEGKQNELAEDALEGHFTGNDKFMEEHLMSGDDL